MSPLVSDLFFHCVIYSAIAVSLGAGVWQFIAELRVRKELK